MSIIVELDQMHRLIQVVNIGQLIRYLLIDSSVQVLKIQNSPKEKINQIFCASVSVVDLRDKVKSNARHIIDIADFLRWEAKEGKKLDQLVLLWTGSPYYCHDREHHFPG